MVGVHSHKLQQNGHGESTETGKQREPTEIKRDCRLYRAAVPCRPNKENGRECGDCIDYAPADHALLFIKLDAAGDVLRSGALLPALRKKHPRARIVWIVKPEFLPLVKANPYVDEAIPYDVVGLSLVQARSWDFVYSLSNDLPSAALAVLSAPKRALYGYGLDGAGQIYATNAAGWSWLEMAAFDRVKKANERSYQEIMYDIAECPLPISRPPLQLSSADRVHANNLISRILPNSRNDNLIGVNVGSGSRWPKKMFGTEEIVSLCAQLLMSNTRARVLLLGGPQEETKIAQILDLVAGGGRVLSAGTTHSLLEFAALIDRCAVLITGDTLALHMATALSVPAVTVFGPTSLAEIHDYDGSVVKIASMLDCLCCYSDCKKSNNCMTTIPIARVVASAVELAHKHAEHELKLPRMVAVTG